MYPFIVFLILYTPSHCIYDYINKTFSATFSNYIYSYSKDREFKYIYSQLSKKKSREGNFDTFSDVAPEGFSNIISVVDLFFGYL